MSIDSYTSNLTVRCCRQRTSIEIEILAEFVSKSTAKQSEASYHSHPHSQFSDA